MALVMGIDRNRLGCGRALAGGGRKTMRRGVRVARVEKAGLAGPKGSKGPVLVMGGPGSQRPGWALSPLFLFLKNLFI